MSNLKVCIASSAGGHLTEILQIKKAYDKYDNFYITFKRENSLELAKIERVYFVLDPGRNIKKFVKNFVQTLGILFKEKPHIIISTGAGVALSTCFLGKFILRAKIIFIESFCRIDKPSITGKLVYPISDLFFVQWEKLLKKYGNKAIYRGAVV